MTATLIVVTGPPGAGKSTVARALSGRFARSSNIAGDDFFAFLDQGAIAPWTLEAHDQNGVVLAAAAAAAGRMAAGGLTVVYDGVVVPAQLDAFADATGLPSLHYVVLLPPEHTCIERVRTRLGHGFTDVEAARHMYAQFADAELDSRHLLSSAAPPDVIASTLVDRVHDRSLERRA